MNIIIYSNCLRNLDISKAASSSEIFELEFADALATKSNVTIVSNKAIKNESNKKVNLYKIDNEVLKGLEYLINEINIYKDNNSKNKIFIFYGYDYFLIRKLMKFCKVYNFKLISFTFDTHLAAIENKKLIKRILIDFYFKLGIKKLNCINGILLFNYDAFTELKLKIPYHITKIGANSLNINQKLFNNNSNYFTITYAGTLIEYNCIQQMLESFKYLDNENLRFNIYGSGPLRDVVLESCKLDNRISYGGVVSKNEIDQILINSDLLLNIRNTNHYVSKYAFPSKIIHYFTSGTPVLTTNVLSNNVLKDISFTIEDVDPKSIAFMINHILKNPLEQKRLSKSAQKFLLEDCNWNNIIPNIINFFKKL